MKKVIFTVMFGDYDLYEPTIHNKDWEHICFTDKPKDSKIWNVNIIKNIKDNRKLSREIKIKFYNYFNCDVCIYIDSKFTIKIDLDKCVADNLKNDFCLMKHNKRTCVYDEAEFCIEHNKDSKEIITKQIESYKKEGFPKKFGLYAPGIMIRKDTPEVRKFMDLWYKEVEKFSYRDIISFSYVLWKNPIKLDLMDFKKTYRIFK